MKDRRILVLGRKTLKRIAKNHRISLEQVRSGIQATTDDAWDTDNLAAIIEQRKLFPDGKPSPEEFIVNVAKMINAETPGALLQKILKSNRIVFDFPYVTIAKPLLPIFSKLLTFSNICSIFYL